MIYLVLFYLKMDILKKSNPVSYTHLDHSIHPHLVRELVRYFSSHETNGQLIFTTHQTCLLNQDFLRTDEVLSLIHILPLACTHSMKG